MLSTSYIKSFFFLLISSVLLAACTEADKREIELSASAFDIKQGIASIKQSNQLYMKSFEAQDSNQLANCYTSDAHLMIADTPAIDGRNDIRTIYSQLMKKGVKEFSLNSEHIWGDSTMLVEEGTYKMTGTNNQPMDKGKYISLWHQEAGNWRIYRHMWNSDLRKTATQNDAVANKK